MTQLYQNTDFTAGRSVFTDVIHNLAQVTFTARPIKVSTAKGPVPMVRARVVLRSDADKSMCDTECPVSVTESVSLEFNVLDGAANLSALRTELNRLVDAAISAYKLDRGLVPPSSATFAES